MRRLGWLIGGCLLLLAVETTPAVSPAQAQGLLPWLTKTRPAQPRTARRPTRPGGTYRTLCVRTCDGFYFPISFKATRSKLKSDNLACLQRCEGAPARLFYHRNPGQSVSQAVDLSGKRYRDLENAFRYRKELVEGCTCDVAQRSESDEGGQ